MATAIEHAVDEKVLGHVVHGWADVNTLDEPAPGAESVGDYRLEGNGVDSESALLGCLVEIENHLLVLVETIILADVIDEFNKSMESVE